MLDLGTVDVAETAQPAVRVVDDLLRHDQRAWTHIGMDSSDRVDAEDAARAKVVQCLHVGAIVDPVRRQRVLLAMPREKGQPLAAKVPQHDRTRRRTERRCHVAPLHAFESRKAVQAGAADDGQVDGHDQLSLSA